MKIVIIQSQAPVDFEQDSPKAINLYWYEGTARGLKLLVSEQSELNLHDTLVARGDALAEAQRVIYVLPERWVNWFDLEVPFTQSNKIKIILPSLLEDVYFDEVDELAVRFKVIDGPQAHARYVALNYPISRKCLAGLKLLELP